MHKQSARVTSSVFGIPLSGGRVLLSNTPLLQEKGRNILYFMYTGISRESSLSGGSFF